MENIAKGFEGVTNGKANVKLFAAIYILSLLLIILSPFGGALLTVAALGLFTISLFFIPTIYSYSLLLGIFPFANIFKLSPDSTSLMTICEMILLAKIILYLFLKKKTFKCNIGLAVGVIFTILYILIFSSQIEYQLIIKLVVRILLVAYYMRSDIAHKGGIAAIKTTAYCFSLSMLISMILCQITVYKDAVSDYLRVIQYSSESELVRNGGLMDDPNYCSMAIIASMIFISVLYYYKKIKFEFWLLVVPLFLLGFTTYSKSYFLMSIAFVAVLLLFVLYPKHKGWAIVSSIAVAIIGLAAYSGQIKIINDILLRFETVGITTGRDELNQIYVNYMLDNIKVLLFGEGFNVTALADTNNVHNLYLEVLFRLGLVGSSIFTATVICCFPKKQHKSKLINYMPATFVFVMYMALAGLDSYALFYYILLAGISIWHIRDLPENTEKAIEGESCEKI